MSEPQASERVLPRYPIYIPTKGRADSALTAKCLMEGGVPFLLVVEEGKEEETYARAFGRERLLVLPFHDLGLGSIPARNYIWEHAKASGAERHWCLDDNIRAFYRRYRGKRVYCDPGIALRVCEDFTDRYDNIAISGLNYMKFVMDEAKTKPLVINCHVYSCILINTALPCRWRGRYNEDTDLCLQVLSAGWCTVLLNAFMADKMTTMKMAGGNMSSLYQGDGRLRMARDLERMWPGVVETKRRFHRAQHVVAYSWRHFDTPLRLKEGLTHEALAEAGPNEYGMRLVQVSEKIEAPRVQRVMDAWLRDHPEGS